MKVLVLSNLYPPDTAGGYELGCRQAVDALRARGHSVRVLTTVPRTPVATPPHVRRTLKLADLWDHYSDGLSAPLTLGLKDLSAFQVNAFNVHALSTEVEDFRPDVVYVWMLVGIGGLGLMACLHHLQVPWVWHLMDEVPTKICTMFYEVRPELAREFTRQIRGTFLSCSRQLVEEIERRGAGLGDRVEVVPNWVFGPRPPSRQSYYHGGHLRVVAAAATLDRNYDKGIDLLIRAAGALRRRGYQDFSIDVFGKASDGSFADLIRTQRLGGHVRLLGSCDQATLIETYGRYDVFAFPGRPGEPFGFAPLEALSRGCVPLIARACGVAEWLVHGVHCYKVERDAEAFAGLLADVLDGRVVVGPVGRRGEAAVWRDFHLDTLLPRIEDALRAAADRPRSGGGSPADAYRLAILAEKLGAILIQESLSV